jgi:endonuclease/exonuclease/phosphatase family metal-dependent hydrolase
LQINSHAFEQYTIAFYNLENLFDYRRNKNILDGEFIPSSQKKWTKERYQTKINKLARAISRIAADKTGRAPHLIGVAEVENDDVLEDLVNHELLSHYDYDYIHYDSPDERGIDVALIFDRSVFKLTYSEPITIHLYDEGIRDTTRDILFVKGELAGSEFLIYVNHWPSRRKGEVETNAKRVEVAKQLVEHIEKQDSDRYRLSTNGSKPLHVVSMGDFNDNPTDESILSGLLPHGFFNHFQGLKNNHRGSVNHDKKWYLFDQILTSLSLDNDIDQQLYVHEVNIFDDIMLREWKGKHRGHPSRTYVGRHYKGGYSDHFPVYLIIRRN